MVPLPKATTWGLGLEHEFLVCATPPSAEERRPEPAYDITPYEILSSSRLVSDTRYGREDERTDANGEEDGDDEVGVKIFELEKAASTGKKYADPDVHDALARHIMSRHPLFAVLTQHLLILALPLLAPRCQPSSSSSATSATNSADRSVAMDILTSSWIEEVLKPLFRCAGRSKGYDDATVNGFAETMRSLISPEDLLIRSLTSFGSFGSVNDSESRDNMASLASVLPQLFKRGSRCLSHVDELRTRSRILLERYLDAVFPTRCAGDVLIVTYTKTLYTLPVVRYFAGGRRSCRSRLSPRNVVSQVETAFRYALLRQARAVYAYMSDGLDVFERRPGWSASETRLRNAVSTDWPFVEVKSMLHERQTMDGILRQVRAAELLVLRIASNSGLPRDGSGREMKTYLFPYSGVVEQDVTARPGDTTTSRVSVSSMKLPYYAGSYHVWITLPHDGEKFAKSPAERARLARVHALLAHRLQWIEPLLMSTMTGDPRAVGNGLSFPRSSMRSVFNRLAGYGTSDPTHLLHMDIDEVGIGKREAILDTVVPFYFVSLPDMLRVYENETETDAKNASTKALTDRQKRNRGTVRLWVKIDGKWVRHRTCADVSRWRAEDMFDMHEGATFVRTRVTFDSVNRREVLYPSLLRKAGAEYTPTTANDIRIQDCGKSLTYRIEPHWEPVWVRLANDPSKKHRSSPSGHDDEGVLQLALFFVNRDRHRTERPTPMHVDIRVVEDAPLIERPSRRKKDSAAELSAVGFEFRALDNCPSQDMVHVLRLIALLAASAESEEARIRSVTRDDNDQRNDANAAVDAHVKRYRAGLNLGWNAALVDVLMFGCFAPVSSRYVRDLELVCDCPGLHQQVHRGNASSAAFDVLTFLCAGLHDRFKGHPVTSLLSSSAGKSDSAALLPPRPVNRNYEAWRRVFSALSSSASSNPPPPLTLSAAEKSPQWRPDRFYLQRLYSE